VLASAATTNRRAQGKYPMYTLDMRFDGYLDASHPTNIRAPGRAIPLWHQQPQVHHDRWQCPVLRALLGYGTRRLRIVMEASTSREATRFPPR